MQALSGLVVVCAIAPWFMGMTGQHGKRAMGQQNWPTAQTTLPLSDTALGWVVLARNLASSLMAVAVVALIGVCWYWAQCLAIFASGATPPADPHILRLTAMDITRYFAAIALTMWLTTGFSTAATLTGRRWLASIPICIIPAWIALMSLTTFLDYPTFSALFGAAAVWALSVLVIGTVVGYVVGIAWNIVKIPTLIFGFALFVVAEAVGLTLLSQYHVQLAAQGYRTQQASSQFATNMFAALLALAAAPPAWIPLATYYNRHR